MSKNESENKQELIRYITNFDLEKELSQLTKEEVKGWIKEEWNELFYDHGVPRGEATSTIIDGNHKWMSRKAENELFVYQTLLELNKEISNETDDETINFLNKEIEKIKK